MSIKISIITVCRNRANFIEQTIKSVINQTHKAIEYIIIDGASTDGTIEIIEQYSRQISYWVTEPDNGMYYAINKGLAVATGEYLMILNSDDILADEHVIENVVDKIKLDKKDWYSGNIIKWQDGKERKIKLFSVSYKQLLLSTHGSFVPHPCFIISKKLNKVLGGYNTNYKYASDYDYILRALNTANTTGNYINLYITKFRVHGGSITSSGAIDSERKAILEHHNYKSISILRRTVSYYVLWVYYKIINVRNKYEDLSVNQFEN